MRERRRILVGITGGIAAYKVPQLVRALSQRGAEVKVVCTPAAFHFVGEETLRTVSGHPVYRDGASFHDIDHIRLAEWADCFAVCPATANTIAKIAHGIADNLLTTLALSVAPCRLIVAPAMNTAMWENAATRENLAALNKRGVTVLPVGEGALACGGFGAGRMIEVPEIADYLLAGAVAGRCFAGKKILISSGPTMEPLDPVRVITNRSSGKMGAALARAGLMGGADVTVVSGPAAAPLPSGARVVRVVTAAQMRDAMIAEFEQTDICIMAAAVGDFRPVKFHSKKIRRIAGDRIALELESTPDILAELGKRKGSRFLIGFALETGEGVAHAKQKMRAKGCDMMVLNRPEEALAGDQTRITIFGLEGAAESCPAMGKDEAAGIILKRAAVRLGLIHD